MWPSLENATFVFQHRRQTTREADYWQCHARGRKVRGTDQPQPLFSVDHKGVLLHVCTHVQLCACMHACLCSFNSMRVCAHSTPCVSVLIQLHACLCSFNSMHEACLSMRMQIGCSPGPCVATLSLSPSS